MWPIRLVEWGMGVGNGEWNATKYVELYIRRYLAGASKSDLAWQRGVRWLCVCMLLELPANSDQSQGFIIFI